MVKPSESDWITVFLDAVYKMVFDTLWPSEVTIASWTAEIPVGIPLALWLGFPRRNDAARASQRTLWSSFLEAVGAGFGFLGGGFLCRRLTLATWYLGCWRVARLWARVSWSQISIPRRTIQSRKALARCWLMLRCVREDVGGSSRVRALC